MATAMSAASSPPALTAKTPNRAGTLVIKIGSSSIVDENTGLIALSRLSRLSEFVCELKRYGYKVIVVTSGAVGVGMRRLGWTERPSSVTHKQMAAAVGQGRLMRVYEDLFSHQNQIIAQVLLTRNDLGEHAQYLNSQNTLRELLEANVIPIINENDSVSAAESRFGDNDTLAALVAGMVDANWLFLMTDVDCLYDSNPRTNPDAKPVHFVDDLQALRSLVEVDDNGSGIGTGGMVTKLTAASLATAAGVTTVITRSDHPERILSIMNGEMYGTTFKAKDKPMGDRQWWIRHGMHIHGRILVDGLALDEIARRNTLSALGIVAVEGTFKESSAVSVVDFRTNKEIARGLVNYSSPELDRIKGMRTSEILFVLGFIVAECVIYRQNLVMLDD